MEALVREGQRTPESAAKVTAVVREFFSDSRISEEAYAHLTDDAPSGDPDDRRHIAAALAAQADLIVTGNLDDFPAGPLAALGLRVATPRQDRAGVRRQSSAAFRLGRWCQPGRDVPIEECPLT